MGENVISLLRGGTVDTVGTERYIIRMYNVPTINSYIFVYVQYYIL